MQNSIYSTVFSDLICVCGTTCEIHVRKYLKMRLCIWGIELLFTEKLVLMFTFLSKAKFIEPLRVALYL